MSQRLVTPADSRSMPWKNGGGATLEIAAAPAGASLDDFAWRASIATIERNGPFSSFAGVDRTLVLLSGAGMRLRIGGEPVLVDTPGTAVAFAGEAAVGCELLAGATRDFNFMVRRERATADVAIVTGEPRDVPRASAFVCHVIAQSCTCELPGRAPVTLLEGHTLVADAADAAGGLRVTPVSPEAAVIVASVREVSP